MPSNFKALKQKPNLFDRLHCLERILDWVFLFKENLILDALTITEIYNIIFWISNKKA